MLVAAAAAALCMLTTTTFSRSQCGCCRWFQESRHTATNLFSIFISLLITIIKKMRRVCAFPSFGSLESVPLNQNVSRPALWASFLLESIGVSSLNVGNNSSIKVLRCCITTPPPPHIAISLCDCIRVASCSQNLV